MNAAYIRNMHSKLIKVQCKDVPGETEIDRDQRKYHNLRQFRAVMSGFNIPAVMLGTAYIVNKEIFEAMIIDKGATLFEVCYMELAPVTDFDVEHYVTVSQNAMKLHK